jgi:APA family basic amino acid/polyamine antiporter
VRNADRTLPRAILLGVAIVVAVYLSVNWAYFHLLGYGGVRDARALAADAISVGSPGLGRRLAAAAVAVSAFGVLNAQFLAGPRLTWAMARDRAFFAPFARLSARFATPVAAIVLLGALATVLTLGLGLARTDLLTTGVVVVDATFFALTGLALPILLRRDAMAGRGRAWRSAVAIAFAALELMAIVGSLLQKDVRIVALTGLGWIVAAAATWMLCFARRPTPAGEDA